MKLLILLNACMELCWIGAWVGFISSSITGATPPLSQVMIPFLLGSVTGVFVSRRASRMLTFLLIHAAVFIFAAASAVHYFQFTPYPFLDPGWIKDLLASTPGLISRAASIFIALCSFVVYLMGSRLVSRQMDHITLCIRFDIGVASFFVLYLAMFLIESKGGFILKDDFPGGTALAFFIFSLLAIGIAANLKGAGRRSSSGSLGTVIAFSIVALSFGTGLVLLFLPYLKEAAQVSFLVIKTVSEPLGPVIMAILRFMFQPKKMRADGAGKMVQKETGDNHFGSDGSGWAEWIAMALAWSLAILLALAAAAATALAVWYFARWLLSRRPGAARPDFRSEPLLAWIARTWLLALNALRLAFSRLKPFKSAGEIYSALQRWGNRSGISRSPQETAIEYGMRLKDSLPGLRQELSLIIDAFNEEAYGGRGPGYGALKSLKRAFLRMRHPAFWPRRARLRLFGN